ncbi:hypothetical protein KIW84_045631 [Lathyrus oleraceus]|uniref:Retrovirus-related Pol polyprotein from transposon TNT 1-94 n=1 Tax=Pisum sativum TaxID=3888 RepID=A0A9D4XP86_PEA|nr:hypothetical protein KIW84_045631 [Pisum sativum]
MWYLDNGCSNHMCGEKEAFSDLDESFRSSVKFGDNSKISVMGKGKVTIQTKGNSTHTITNVLFVPDLKTNLLSVGQLQEKGYEIFIKDGACQIQDAKLGLIAQVNMTANRMFPLYLHNTAHSSPTFAVKNLTPEEAWSGRKPTIDYFRIFGCIAYAHIPDEKRRKLDNKGEKCIFLGVSDKSKAYKLYNPSTMKIVISRYVLFDEKCTWSWNQNGVKESIPADFDDEEKVKQRMEKEQEDEATQIVPTDQSPLTAESQRPQCVRRRPAWMIDYEVTGVDQEAQEATWCLYFKVFNLRNGVLKLNSH